MEFLLEHPVVQAFIRQVLEEMRQRLYGTLDEGHEHGQHRPGSRHGIAAIMCFPKNPSTHEENQQQLQLVHDVVSLAKCVTETYAADCVIDTAITWSVHRETPTHVFAMCYISCVVK